MLKTFYLPAKSTKLILLTVSQGMSWSNFAYSLSTNKQKKTIFIDLLFILNLLVILWRRYKEINLNGPTKCFCYCSDACLSQVDPHSLSKFSRKFIATYTDLKRKSEKHYRCEVSPQRREL